MHATFKVGVFLKGLDGVLEKSKLWAYPSAIVVFAAFSVYQIYQFLISHSAVMLALTILDVFVIALTWAEYSLLRHRPSMPARLGPQA